MNLEKRNQSMKDFFTEKIDTYDNVHCELMNTKKIVTEVLDPSITHVLDLGAGTGLELISLFERFPTINVTAIDLTPRMLEELKKREFSNHVTTICGDFFEVEFGDQYDAVISTSALHHFDQSQKCKLYQKIYNCLKQNGQFINSDRFLDTQQEEDQMMREFIENPNHKSHLDTPLWKKNEEKILKEVGFEEIEFTKLESTKGYYLLKTRKR